MEEHAVCRYHLCAAVGADDIYILFVQLHYQLAGVGTDGMQAVVLYSPYRVADYFVRVVGNGCPVGFRLSVYLDNVCAALIGVAESPFILPVCPAMYKEASRELVFYIGHRRACQLSR